MDPSRPEEYLYSIYLGKDDDVKFYEIRRCGLHGDAPPETTTFRIPTAEEYPPITAFASIGSKIYIIGGYFPAKNLCSTDIFVVETQNLHTNDPAQIVRKIPSVLHAGVRFRNAVAIGGKIYTFPLHFGHRPEYPPAASRFEVFDPATETTRLLPEPPVRFPRKESGQSFLALKTHFILFIKRGGGQLVFSFDTAREDRGWKDVNPKSTYSGGRFYRKISDVTWDLFGDESQPDPILTGRFGTKSPNIMRKEVEGKRGERGIYACPRICAGPTKGVDSTSDASLAQPIPVGRSRAGPLGLTRRETEKRQPIPVARIRAVASGRTRRETQERGIPVYSRTCRVCDHRSFLVYVIKSLRIYRDPFSFSTSLLTTRCATALGGHGDDGSRFFATVKLEGRPLCHAVVMFRDDLIRIEKWYKIIGIPQELVGRPCFSYGGNVFFTYMSGDRLDSGTAGWEFKKFSLAYVSKRDRAYYAAQQVFSYRLPRRMFDIHVASFVIPASISSE